MKNEIIISGTVLMIATEVLLGADGLSSDLSLRYDQGSDKLYRSHELSLDLFGGVTVGEYTIDHLSGARTLHNGRLGVGTGANYFFSRHFGVQGEVFTENTQHSFIDSASGSFVLRFPIGKTGLAAYAFGGGGHQFDRVPSTSLHTGAGLEYRFSPHLSLFIQPRIVFRNKISNYGLGRFGMRLVF